MTIQTASLAATPKQRTMRLLTAAAGAVLALSAVASIGAWQASRDGGTSTREQPSASVPAPATVRTIIGRATDSAPTYYLVASPAQAATVSADLDEANAVRATAGEPSQPSQIAPLESAEAAADFFHALNSGDAIRATLNLPPVRVVDLRPTALAPVGTLAAATEDARTSLGGRQAPTIYLASASTQADALRATIAQDAAYAQEVNAPPAPDAAVTVVASEQDLARLMYLAGAADELNAARGLPALQVVDRRAS